MADDDAVQSWWDGLSPEEQDDAIRSRDAGRPSETMRRSMEAAGLVDRGHGNIPERVLQHLDERGGGRPGDSMDGGKMRH